MIVTEDGLKIQILGDTHLGRQFIHGVPLARRGEREAMVWADFNRNLEEVEEDTKLHVHMGDLFDKWIVPYELILTTAKVYAAAAKRRPDTTFIILRGNHDIMKDLDRASAFDVFANLVAHVPNIRVFHRPQRIGNLLFYPWSPVDNASEEVAKHAGVVAAFGHWDTDFSEHNLVPTKAGIPTLYTGHVHKRDEFTRDGTRVVVVGSMQPYAHGEESDDELYITLKASEVADRTDLRNKCVRIIGRYADEVDCLQLSFKAEDKDTDDTLPDVNLGDFDIEALFRKAFQDAGVKTEVMENLLAQFQVRRVSFGA